jgi:IS1 family transposase
MNKLTDEKRCAVVRALVDGCSVAATCRTSGVAKNTVQKLTRDLGEACLNFQDKMLRNLRCNFIECDEIWCFCYAKDKNLPDHMKGQPGVGSMWTWTAMDAESKLIVSWRLGARDAANAQMFMADVAERLTHRVQMTTDGNTTYLRAIEDNFWSIDYAMLVKQYGKPEGEPEQRYSPAKCLGAKKRPVKGNPDLDHVSTSYAERQNLNIRMQNRRYTRLTNGYSKKADILAYSVAISFMYHNWVRVHQTLNTTPAIAQGIATRKWSIQDMVELTDVPMFAGK